MADSNQFGLSRNIPSDVKQAVRNRCGFGCVVCGLGIYDYEHFSPEFKDARNHSEEGITLLCTSCHRKKKKGHLSLNQISKANQNPKAKQLGFASDFFFLENTAPRIRFAGNEFINCNSVISFFGKSCLSIAQNHTDPAGPMLMNAQFHDAENKMIFSITDNEWQASSDNWDVEFEGSTLRIRSSKKLVSLALRFSAPDMITITKINMRYGDAKIIGDDKKLRIWNGEKVNNATVENCVFGQCNIGISIRDDGIAFGAAR